VASATLPSDIHTSQPLIGTLCLCLSPIQVITGMRTRVHETGKGLERSRARRTQRCCGEKSPLSEGARLDISWHSWRRQQHCVLCACVCARVCV